MISIKVEIDGESLTLPVTENAKIIVEGVEYSNEVGDEIVQLHVNVNKEGVVTDLCSDLTGTLEVVASSWSTHSELAESLSGDNDD